MQNMYWLYIFGTLIAKIIYTDMGSRCINIQAYVHHIPKTKNCALTIWTLLSWSLLLQGTFVYIWSKQSRWWCSLGSILFNCLCCSNCWWKGMVIVMVMPWSCHAHLITCVTAVEVNSIWYKPPPPVKCQGLEYLQPYYPKRIID